MLPYLLAAVGGYLIGDSMKDSQKFADGGMMADGGMIKKLNDIESKIKNAMKENNKWHFIDEEIGGKKIQIKMFVGKKEVDVQIFRINGLSATMPKNYVGKRETLKMIMDNIMFTPYTLSNEMMADGGIMAKGGGVKSFMYKVSFRNNKGVFTEETFSAENLNDLKRQVTEKFGSTDDVVGVMKFNLNNRRYFVVESTRSKKFADGGMMAEGGMIKKGDMVEILSDANRNVIGMKGKVNKVFETKRGKFVDLKIEGTRINSSIYFIEDVKKI